MAASSISPLVDGLYLKLEGVDGLRSIAGNLSLKPVQDSERGPYVPPPPDGPPDQLQPE